MKTPSISWLPAICIPLFFFSACTKKSTTPATLKVGLVTGIGNLTDKGFNQLAYEGLLTAAMSIPMEIEAKESSSAEAITQNIAYFTGKGVDVIITLGYNAAQSTLDAAKGNPSIKFILLDYAFVSLPSNMTCGIYQVDEASFPCGFLAAYWAGVKKPDNPAVGYVAGPDIPTIRQFTTSFTAGVAYYNSKYGKNATVSGAFATSFIDTIQGGRIADSLISKGAEVIFACAGKTGNGALYKTRDAGKAGIGVDTDQHETIPQVGSSLITSCMKHLDESIISEMTAISQGKFHGGQTTTSNLLNNGVDLAPYHEFDTLLPDSIKQAVITIKQGIISGAIKTGWQ